MLYLIPEGHFLQVTLMVTLRQLAPLPARALCHSSAAQTKVDWNYSSFVSSPCRSARCSPLLKQSNAGTGVGEFHLLTSHPDWSRGGEGGGLLWKCSSGVTQFRRKVFRAMLGSRNRKNQALCQQQVGGLWWSSVADMKLEEQELEGNLPEVTAVSFTHCSAFCWTSCRLKPEQPEGICFLIVHFQMKPFLTLKMKFKKK